MMRGDDALDLAAMVACVVGSRGISTGVVQHRWFSLDLPVV
jgi:hypothetical protein